jgi:hypothetical protein
MSIQIFQISLYEGFVTLDNRQHLTRQPFDIQSNPSHVHLQVKTGRDSAPWIIERSIDRSVDSRVFSTVYFVRYALQFRRISLIPYSPVVWRDALR